MNKRLPLLCFALLLVVATWLWWRHMLKSAPIVNTPQTPIAQATVPSAQPIIPQTPLPIAKRQLPGAPYEASDPRWQWMREQEKRDPSWEWKMPMNFYGKVIDQDGLPVAEASVELGWNDLSKEGSSEKNTVSDKEGFFSLIGQTGKLLQVTIRKDGYYTPKQAHLRSFEYADFSQANYIEPDPNNPVIFHLRKKGTGEPLLSGRTDVRMLADGTPVRVDLLNKGSLSPDGQLEISAVTSTEKYPPRFFDWQATISVPGGGLLEYSDEFPFTAPEAGYVPQDQFNFPANATGWKRVMHKSYYITFGSPPKYGRIEIHLNGGSQVAHVRYWINPSGSICLEPGGTKQAAAP